MAYAEGTSVPVEKSQAEIRAVLTRYGADGFAFAEEVGAAMIGFRAKGRMVRFVLPVPRPDDDRFWTPRLGETGKEHRSRNGKVAYWRRPGRAAEAHAQEVRRLWRALLLSIKAKLEVVQSGIETFEQAFLAHVVLPDQRTVGEAVLPWVAESYKSGSVKLLPGWSGAEVEP